MPSYSLFHTLNISRQDMLSRLLDLDVTSNNLANVNTAGYKASRSNFQELLQEASREGIHLAGTQIMTQQGALRSSTNPLDWAIQGEGMFAVRMPDGRTGYTRDGQFHLDANRNLVTSSGYPLVWQGQIPADLVDLAVRQDGTVEAVLASGARSVIGSVQLTRFSNPTGLLANGDNVWLAGESSGEAQTGAPGTTGMGWISSHAVEQSNASMSYELTHLMTLQQNFQMTVRTFQQTDQMIVQAINMRKA